jgi:hypothetical protein
VPQLVVERCNCGLILMEYSIPLKKKKEKKSVSFSIILTC